MELGEATALADKFITALYFRVWSVPLHKGSKIAHQWWRNQGSTLSVEDALEENRRQLGHFSVRDKIDKSGGRSLHLRMSALTIDREEGRCPALEGAMCGIYESRPFSCRTVPLHYAKPLSLLGSSLDKFVNTPGYLCDTSARAPVVLDGEHIADTSIQRGREDALNQAKLDQRWKSELLSRMDDPGAALAAGLPSYESVLANSKRGFGTSVPMLVAWRVAKDAGIMAPSSFGEICEQQIALLKREVARVANLELAGRLVEMLSGYEAAYANAKPRLPLLPPRGE